MTIYVFLDTDLKIRQTNGAVVLTVKVVPGSSKTALAGLLDDMLKVKIAAPAEKGKANQALIDLLAEKLNVKKKNISIISGQTNPVKKIQINGISEKTLADRLNLNE